MLRRIPKLLLLAALLAAFAASSIPAFGKTCLCTSCFFEKRGCGGCRFDNKTSQCVNISCGGFCFF